MAKISLLIVLFASLVGCTTYRLGQGDHWLQWPQNGATLYVYGNDGQLAAYGKELLNLPGYYFANGGVTFFPGKRRIGFYCEPPASQTMIFFDSLPSLEYDFKQGESYDLRCENGRPVISRHKLDA